MARASTISPDAELPIQAPVEEPIINSPYVVPKAHWACDKSGKANKISGRRDARYFWTTQRVITGQTELESIGGDYGSEPLPLVNALRADVKKWRESGYENASQVTKKLSLIGRAQTANAGSSFVSWRRSKRSSISTRF